MLPLLGIMHILVRDGLADRDYIAKKTLGFDRVERDILPNFPPRRVAEITGLRSMTSRPWPRCTARRRPPSSASARA